MSDVKISAERLAELEKIEAKKKEQKAKEKRYWTMQKLMIRKAVAAGIKVTDAEIDAEIAATAK